MYIPFENRLTKQKEVYTMSSPSQFIIQGILSILQEKNMTTGALAKAIGKNKKEIIFASSFGDAETKFRNEKLKRIEQIKEI